GLGSPSRDGFPREGSWLQWRFLGRGCIFCPIRLSDWAQSGGRVRFLRDDQHSSLLQAQAPEAHPGAALHVGGVCGRGDDGRAGRPSSPRGSASSAVPKRLQQGCLWVSHVSVAYVEPLGGAALLSGGATGAVAPFARW